MLITKRSIMTGVTRTMDLDVTEEQLANWRAGQMAQYAFPQLSAAQREFIITGVTDEEWQILQDQEDTP